MKNHTMVGLACMAVGMSLIPVSDSLAKYIGQLTPYSAGFMAWSRFAIGLIVIGPLAWHLTRFRNLERGFYPRQALRGALLAATITCIITAVTLSPLPDVFGAFFVGPAMAVIFSAIFLGERASGLEWIAVILGFVGVVLVVQPGVAMSAGLIWGLVAGIFYGGFLTATRWAAKSGPPVAQLATQLFFGCVFLIPLGIGDVFAHGIQQPQWLLLMGTSSAAANYLSIIALGKARPAFLAPVIYLQIVVATIIGLVFFNDSLSALAASGLALIVLTGLLRIPSAMRHH